MNSASAEQTTEPLAYWRSGTGEPLLLIHGLGATGGIWSPVLPALAAQHDVVAVDLPGFGDSAPLIAPPSVPAIADVIEGQLAELGLGTVHIAGSSLGGWIAFELARRGRAETVAAIAPLGLGSKRENRRTRRRLRFAHATASLIKPLAGPMSRTALGRTLLNGLARARPWRAETAETAETLRAFVGGSSFGPVLDWGTSHAPEGLAEVKCPVSVVWGSRDLVLSPRQASRWTEHIPQAELRLLKGLGHVPMSDDPELVATTILDCTRGDRK